MKKTILCTLGLSSIVALSFASCGGGDKKLASVDVFCEAVAQKVCQVTERCAASAAEQMTCLTTQKKQCTTFAAANTTTKRLYRPEKAQACVDETNGVYDNTTITQDDIDGLTEICSRVFSGTGKVLEACDVDFDCEGDLICDKKACAEQVVKGKADLCTNPGEVCDDGYYCLMMPAGYMCVAKKAKGEMCNATTPCAETLKCSSGTCLDRSKIGEACTASSDCAKDAPFCDVYAGNKCSTGLSFASGSPSCKAFIGGGGTPVDGGADMAPAVDAGADMSPAVDASGADGGTG